MVYDYKTNGVCSNAIHFEIDNGIVKNVVFDGGCDGNTQGVEKLVDGMKADEAVKKLKGILCGNRGTSCPDQLARALENAMCPAAD